MNHIDSISQVPFHHIFSHHASHHFNKRMKGVLGDLSRDIAHALGDNLLCIVIGGTYGRGEGRIHRRQANLGTGVWSGGESPLDDMDLLVLVKAPAFNQVEFSRVCTKYREILGVDLDILGVLTPSQLKRIRPDFHWHGIARSHKTIWGDPLLASEILSELVLVPDAGDGSLPEGKTCADDSGTCGVPFSPVDMRASRNVLLDEAYRLAGECMCHALSTLVLMASPELTWDGCFYVCRLDKSINQLGAAVLLSAGVLPGGPAEDRKVFLRLAAETGENEHLAHLGQAYLDQHDMGSYAREAGQNEAAVRSSWSRYLEMLDWVVSWLDDQKLSPGSMSQPCHIWKDRSDWQELRGLVHLMVSRTGETGISDREMIRLALSRIARNFIQL